MRKKYPVVGDQGRPGTRFRPADGFMDCVVASAPRNDEPYCHREPEECGRGGPCRLCSSLTGFGSLRGITARRKVERTLHGLEIRCATRNDKRRHRNRKLTTERCRLTRE